MNINTQQVLSVARWIVSVAGGFVVGKGWITTEHLTTVMDKLPEIIGGIAAIATLIWGVANKTDRSMLVQASHVQGVTAVVVDTKTAPAPVVAAVEDQVSPSTAKIVSN